VKARWFVLAWGALCMCVGVWVLIQPRGLVQSADLFLTSSGLWVAVVLRLLVGVLMWMSATVSRTPRVLRVLGALFVFSAFALPVVGLERMRRIADWGAGLGDPVLRGVSLVVVGLGAFIVWTVWPRRSER
jgi:hypothetical protein